MRVGFKGFLLFSAVTVLPTGIALAQSAAPVPQAGVTASQTSAATARGSTTPGAQTAPQPIRPGAAAGQSTVQQPLPAAPVVPVLPPLPPPIWTTADAQQLLVAILNAGKEGLDVRDYDAAGLIAAMRSGDPAAMSAAATQRFNRLSSDFALGHVRGSDRQNWHIPDPDLDLARQDALLRAALQQRRVGEALRGLLPLHPQYTALKHALEIAPKTEVEKVNRIRLNMDRWRWLPRDLGQRYIIVNVPAYTAALVDNGQTVSRHRAVAGAIKTPTPQLQAIATGVILNPWWEVPKSIEPEVRGKRGYVAVKGADGKIQRWRQPPGPSNALGQIKFVMPNPQAIYLHDTTARGLFDAKSRAYSHGCIRTEHIMLLATKLLTEGNTEWTPEKIRQTVASRKSVQANFANPIPVYIIYMSSAALQDGSIKDYADIYKKDGKVLAALNDEVVKKPDRAVASR